MPVFLGYDGETGGGGGGGGGVSERPGGGEVVGTRGRDLVQEETKEKAELSEESGDSQKHGKREGKESEEKEIIRRTSVVEILRRNVGASKTTFANNVANDNSPKKDSDSLNTTDLELDLDLGLNLDLDLDLDLELGSLARSEAEESDSKSWDLSTSLRYGDSELSESEDTAESDYYTVTGGGGDGGGGGAGDSWRSKEHVYCTVYCIANDDYRKPSQTSTTSTEDSAAGARSLLPPIHSPDPPDPELGDHSDPYTLSDLVDSAVLTSAHSSTVSVVLTCRICLDDRHSRPLHCCQKAVCEECLKTYISSQVLVGRADIVCPITECSGFLEESVVVTHLASEELAKYKYFLELSRLDSSTKPCPQCSLFTSLKGRSLQAPSKAEHKYKIQCSKCQFVWCFKCHAPWHEGLKCREYRKGDKLLRHWASVIEHGQRNAQKCPRCKIHIQRTEGCDHMTCTQCNTNFCYRCGEKYRHLRFFGDHTSNLSVFGCKYRYLPDKPHLRRLVRGSVCVSKVLMAPVVIVLVVVVGALALVIGLFAFPIYYICKKRRKHSNGSGRWLC
ncbi:putative E3 ubiquitin-protein ligase RNF217 [Astyanax mexicanus]|uniref:E3 ubiquitin-protein ligase RNF217 n=1 Tax=Astyanax mexicanus TaxID=7994 RepID=A0A8B9KYL1_ASTMX|nr:putative E3 ubiquitin-protein ligase RNF217 [Astyanax mexicanus]